MTLVMIKITRNIVFFSPCDDGISDVHMKNIPKPGVEAMPGVPALESQICGFQASLVYTVNSRPASEVLFYKRKKKSR